MNGEIRTTQWFGGNIAGNVRTPEWLAEHGIDPNALLDTSGNVICTCITSPCGCAAYGQALHDVSISDTLRSKADMSLGWPLGNWWPAASQDVPLGDARLTTDVPTTRPQPTWDQMGWIEKAGRYLTQVIPGAVADTLGMTARAGAQTPASVLPSLPNVNTTLILMVAALLLGFLMLRRIG